MSHRVFWFLQRRTRAQTPAAEKASDFADGSPEHEDSPDEQQEEFRPQSKRSRTAETSAHIAEQSLIGDSAEFSSFCSSIS